MACTYGLECTSPTEYNINGKDYCRPHGLAIMMTSARPKCQFNDGTEELPCRGHVYDGRNDRRSLCKEHGGL